MDVDFIFKQVQHMAPASFSPREQQRYRAEKMLMRQFMLMKEQHRVPVHLSTKDLKAWLLAGRSFLEEFQEIANQAEARKLLVAELGWTSARRLCLNQMEQELQEELEKEKRLSLQFRRKVTLEGLQMFLSVIRPKAEQDARTFLCQLSSKLLGSFTCSHTSNGSKLALLLKLRWAIVPLAAQVVDIALKFLLDQPEPLVEAEPSQARGSTKSRDSSLACTLRNQTRAAGAKIGGLLADTAAACFCLNTSFTKAHLLQICTSVAWDVVGVVYKRFVERSKTFHLMNFDESFIAAQEGVISAIQDMDDGAQNAACRGAHPLFTEKPPEVCCVKAAESTGDNEDNVGRRGVRNFFKHVWRKMMRLPTEQ